MPSYTRFVELIPTTLAPLCSYWQTHQGQPTGIQFIDSLPIRVCHNRRIYSRRVFAGVARGGRSSVDWFLGDKLLLRKRTLIECVKDQLKSVIQIEHTPTSQRGQHAVCGGGLHLAWISHEG